VMLQQTRVETVIPYWHRFLARFPSVEALASADLSDVLKAWEGLGYHGRARNLHRAAGEVVQRFGGRLPEQVTDLRTLPGFGPYMAGAVASIAFGLAEPLVDGNVARVLTRLHGIAEPPSRPAVHRRLWDIARGMVPADDPGGFNQALMELGATVCTPRAPRCGECPLAAPCVARAEGRPEAYPAKSARRAVPHHDIAVGVVARGGKLLLVRRPEGALLGGLWEFPGGRLEPGEAPEAGLSRTLKERFALAVRPGAPLAPVAHAFTHRKVTLHPFACRAPRGAVRPLFHTEHRWVDPGAIDALALPRAHHKIVTALAAARSAPGLFDA